MRADGGPGHVDEYPITPLPAAIILSSRIHLVLLTSFRRACLLHRSPSNLTDTSNASPLHSPRFWKRTLYRLRSTSGDLSSLRGSRARRASERMGLPSERSECSYTFSRTPIRRPRPSEWSGQGGRVEYLDDPLRCSSAVSRSCVRTAFLTMLLQTSPLQGQLLAAGCGNSSGGLGRGLQEERTVFESELMKGAALAVGWGLCGNILSLFALVPSSPPQPIPSPSPSLPPTLSFINMVAPSKKVSLLLLDIIYASFVVKQPRLTLTSLPIAERPDHDIQPRVALVPQHHVRSPSILFSQHA